MSKSPVPVIRAILLIGVHPTETKSPAIIYFPFPTLAICHTLPVELIFALNSVTTPPVDVTRARLFLAFHHIEVKYHAMI